MRKVYRYKNLSVAVADNEAVNFTVQFISDGNTGQTVVNIPGPTDPSILDSGTVALGTGASLRSEDTIVVSDVANLAPQEDEVRIQYLVNGKLLVEHSNQKSESDRPMIILMIQFPAQ
jgi:hypothetical protein